MEPKWLILFKLFFTFFKISPLTFGGGYAMISLIEIEVVQKNKWVQKEDIIDVFTVAQTVPGAVAINSAVFIGYRVAGLSGAIMSLLGIILPTLLIVILVSLTYYFFRDSPLIKAAFNGIGAAIVALIVYAGFTLGRTVIKNLAVFIIMLLSVVLLLLFSVNPILVIIGGSIIGVFILKIKSPRKEEDTSEIRDGQKTFFKDS